MKRRVAIVGALLLLAPFAFFFYEAFFFAQRADYGWTPHVTHPAFTSNRPTLVFDATHGNATTGRFEGRGWPLARLLRADGFNVVEGKGAFTASALTRVDVLLVINASGARRRQAFGINLNPNGGSERGKPAFTSDEIAAVHAWVEQGGALLLIADHAPFGAASAAMARAFGVTMHQGFLEVPGERSDPLVFSRANGRLGDHPILQGVDSVQTFTGQSLDGPPGSTILLRLPPNAVESVPDSLDHMSEHPGGSAQGLAFEVGKGRVVVLGEAAMMTAQVSERKRFGMNTGQNDNQQFALNAFHWLLRRM